MNKADNAAGSKAIDSLINYETVKVEKLHTNLSKFSNKCDYKTNTGNCPASKLV